MSYILDALRRADAERERGRVPGLHTQVTPGEARAGASRRRPPRTRRAPLLAGLAALGAAALALAWWTLRDGPDAVAPSATRTATLPTPAPTAPAARTRPSVQPEPPPAPPPRIAAAPAPTPRPVAPPILAPAPPPPTPAPPSAAAAPRAATPAPAPAAAPAPAPTAGATSVAELDAASRAQLPPLKLSGSTYASNPALRMLILDGQVVHEGQEIAPGLKLESIGPRAAVLVHQGRRLRLPY